MTTIDRNGDPGGAMEFHEQKEIERLKAQAALELEAVKAREAEALERYKYTLSSNLMLGRATIEFGLHASKSLIIVNGAAVIAVMTFIGNSTKIGANVPDPAALGQALALFAWGTAAALIVAVLSYISQSLIAERPNEPDGRDPVEGTAFRYAGVGFGVISALLFLCGVLNAVQSFRL